MKITHPLYVFALASAVGLAGCTNDGVASAGNPPAEAAHGAQSDTITKQGFIRQGIECPVLQTDDGEMWALNLGNSETKIGDYVKVSGHLAQMSICMQGEGTISPAKIETLKPPAQD